MRLTPRPYQQEAIDRGVAFFQSAERENALMVLPTGCHEKGYKILMYNGTLKAVEDIAVGDIVMGDNNTPRTVLTLHRGQDDMFRITPKYGKPFIVNGDHILNLYRTPQGGNMPSQLSGYDEISVRDYIKSSKWYKHIHKLHRTHLLRFENETKLPLDPYFIGLLIGDGSIGVGNATISITTNEPEVTTFIYDYCHYLGYGIRASYKKTTDAISYCIQSMKTEGQGYHKKSTLRLILEDLGLFGKAAGEKHIPHIYLTSSVENRKSLLAGLVDTDAWYDEKKNSMSYCTKSLQLAHDVQFLCRSLGLFSNIGKPKVVNNVQYYVVSIGGCLDMIPNLVERRQARQRTDKKDILVCGFDVEYVGIGDYYGFELDGNHLYLDWQLFVHHNSGKSILITSIANALGEDMLVFQPSLEILQQNLEKMRMYTDDCSAYSASANEKIVSKITFATIGSVKEHIDEFKHFHYVMVDEAHLVGTGETTMYLKFLSMLDCKVLGLTATPYRLSSDTEFDYDTRKMRSVNARLTMLTNEDNAFFKKMLYVVQVKDMIEHGFLCKPTYYEVRPKGWDEKKIYTNSMGSDYSEKSVQWMMEMTDMNKHVVGLCRRLLHPKGKPRNGILVFVQFVEDAEEIASQIAHSAVVTGQTTKKNRERIIGEFKEGKIKVLLNCSTLTTGFDYPALDTIVMARPTMSLSLYSQIVGRVVRKYDGKDAWVIDCVGNCRRFGRMENLYIGENNEGSYETFGWVYNFETRSFGWKQLTGVILNKKPKNC